MKTKEEVPVYLKLQNFALCCVCTCIHTYTECQLNGLYAKALCCCLAAELSQGFNFALISTVSDLKPHCFAFLKLTLKLFLSLLVFLILARFCTARLDSDLNINVTFLQNHIRNEMCPLLCQMYYEIATWISGGKFLKESTDLLRLKTLIQVSESLCDLWARIFFKQQKCIHSFVSRLGFFCLGVGNFFSRPMLPCKVIRWIHVVSA